MKIRNLRVYLALLPCLTFGVSLLYYYHFNALRVSFIHLMCALIGSFLNSSISNIEYLALLTLLALGFIINYKLSNQLVRIFLIFILILLSLPLLNLSGI